MISKSLSLSKNEIPCLKSLSSLPANQAPVQIQERWRSLDQYISSRSVSRALNSLLKKGFAKRQGIRGAYYYTITEAGKKALGKALEAERLKSALEKALRG